MSNEEKPGKEKPGKPDLLGKDATSLDGGLDVSLDDLDLDEPWINHRLGTYKKADAIAAHIDSLNRQPFRDALSVFMSAAPEKHHVEKFAEKSPDRWAQSVAILGRLGGFHDKLEVEGILRVESASDAELQKELREMEAALGKPALGLEDESGPLGPATPAPVVDGEVD